jgi:polyketide biosynthesis 3-hydroxy-3-methylglutaryl-CoA synthase-like enzyme PksG
VPRASRAVRAGIEAMNLFGGTAYLDVAQLAAHRRLDTSRFTNLLMKEKAVALVCEDPITFGANAARPIIDGLSAEEKNRIELLITCSESGIDFGKSISTYLHQQLELNRNCRLFEIKQACYSGTAGLQMAVSFVLSQASPGAKALVIATDISRFVVTEGGRAQTEDWAFAEPSSGAGAVALLVSDQPLVFQLDVGASGYYGYEVMDTCRPVPDGEAGDSDLSLLSYLDCLENAFLEYRKRVSNADYRGAFRYLAFHTPFGGMVKGAHRTMMRKIAHAKAEEIDEDFQRRVAPGMAYCQRVGNIMGGTVLMSLASTIEHGDFASPQRVGCFSYGSGCCSEFYSGVVTVDGQERQRRFKIDAHLENRYQLSIAEYLAVLRGSAAIKFGTRNATLDDEVSAAAAAAGHGEPRLILREIKNFHRCYEWTA